ncbi:Beta-glucosidase [Quillaja saponaria]|uniref:Beta-glucosidase n=1 Tax=Quillaja saponaria TaxID=32244 RepID=A0AAD7PMW3_QUISA|nr:Beta-glucosidase [Quillaja saponaria]
MALKDYLILALLLILLKSVSIIESASLNRRSFPTGFIFGTASSAYQYEGAANEDGRGPSIWDTFTHRFPGKIADRSNGDITVDAYHRYKEDVEIMKHMNLDAYRFSISWSRVLPKGKLSGGVNIEGIKYYNNLINELIANGLKPYVTLFHWDLPQALEDDYGGFSSPRIVKDFQDYAEFCFKEFGDKVKHWITLNEPLSVTFGLGPCDLQENLNCTTQDPGREPYFVSHNQLLAHAAAASVYKANYQAHQKGLIGIALNSNWFVPFSIDKFDYRASRRALDFMFGWFMEPLITGDYPLTMRSLVKDRLPKFSKDQSNVLKGSLDFLGLNYYTSAYAAHAPDLRNNARPNYGTDSLVKVSTVRNGIPIGPKAASDWLYVYPRGLQDLLLYIKNKYNNPVIYITENGIDELNDPKLSLEQALNDTYRIDYYHQHLYYLQRAIKNGVNVKGYFAWSLLDNFEWGAGYVVRFGINYVDYKDGLKRYPKFSARWFTNFLQRH